MSGGPSGLDFYLEWKPVDFGLCPHPSDTDASYVDKSYMVDDDDLHLDALEARLL